MAKKDSHRGKKQSSSWTGALIGLVALATLIGAGILWSSRESHLVPYDQYQESRIQPASQTVEEEPDASSDEDTPLPDIQVSESEDAVQENLSATDSLQLAQLNQPKPPGADLPRKTLEHISKGMGLSEQGKYELAELEFEQAAQISPNSPEVFAIWGAAQRMQGKFEGANKRFARAYELAPDDDEITFNWGMSLLHEKNADKAIEMFQKTVELAPKHFLAYNYLGKSYGLKKQYHKEAAAYEKAIEIKEDFGQAHFNLGVVLSLMKEFDAAGPHFTRAIEIDPEFDKPFVNQFLVAMGLRQGKKADLKKVEKNKPEKKEDTAEAATKHEHEAHGKEHAAHAEEDNKQKQDPEGSHQTQETEGSEGSDKKIVRPITNITGVVKINGEPAGSPGLVILETKSKLKVPEQQAQKLSIFQRGLQFEPRNSVVMIGSTVEFINDDREVHNIFSKSRNNQFNLGAMAAGTSRSITLDTPGPIVLRCNLHKDMVGTLFVVPNGYYSRPGENGEYHFDQVKSQDYLMQYWHPRLSPEEVQANMKNASLTGIDQTMDVDIKSQSQPGEVHDMVDETDYNLLVDNIEKEIGDAIQNWKDGKKYLSHKRMLKAITYYFDGGGLKGAIAKSFSEKRSLNLEKSLDEIRKKIAGLKGDPDDLTQAQLKGMAERAVAQLRNNVQELYARIKPDKTAVQ